jgi:dihydrofolate synthase/folylpolyglutamate synthase
MEFKEALLWLYSFKKFGSKLGLERINLLMKEIKNPHNNLKIVHVTGTNGKGSVCKFIGSILHNAGYNVGVYISPHLQHFSERISINNEEISKKEIVELIEGLKPIIEKMISQEKQPTFFEIVTAMALKYFHDCKVDFAVIEVGLGGRFDATNVVNPILSIITNISLEHTNCLGENIQSIAYEKAGIIKENIHVITAAKEKAREVIENVAKEKKSSITIVSENSWKRTSFDKTHQDFTISGLLKNYTVKTTQLGRYQGENIAISVMAVEHLQMNGVYLTDENIYDGIHIAFNPGRMEIVSENPTILLDGAHNTNAIEMLKLSLKTDFSYKKLILILGILKDKNYKKMIASITPISDKIIFTKSNNLRACTPELLSKVTDEIAYENEVVTINSISKAIDYAKSIANKDDIICISGSLFTVGEARQYLISPNKKILEC